MRAQRCTIDWAAVRQSYAEGVSLRALARRYDVPYSTLRLHAIREEWARPPTAEESPAQPEVSPEIEILGEPTDTAQRRFLAGVDRLAARVIAAVDKVEDDDTAALRQLTMSLRDLAALRGYDRQRLDIEEQQARIDVLHRRSESEQAPRQLTIAFIGESEEASE